jgi:hypothetical protein
MKERNTPRRRRGIVCHAPLRAPLDGFTGPVGANFSRRDRCGEQQWTHHVVALTVFETVHFEFSSIFFAAIG